MNMHQPQPMTELQRQHLAHKERQQRFAAATSPMKQNKELQETVYRLEGELAAVKKRLKSATDTLQALTLDKSDQQAIIVAQAERICVLEGVTEKFREPFRKPVKQIILDVLSQYPGITYDDIIGPRRHKVITEPRQKCMAAVYEQRPDLSMPVIAKMFRRDHTTLLHATRKMGVWRGGAE